MIWQDKPRKRPDTNVLFVVSFRDGSRSFLRVPPRLAAFGASPAVLRHAAEEQRQGRLHAGDIDKLIKAR
jgi:hypothetical protein